MIGTIEKRKGQDIFIEAIRRMNPTLAAKALFRVVGSGTETEFIAQFRKAAAVFSNIRVDEAVDYEESLRLIASVDVLVCASRDESMPLTILEAMCFRKTVVTTAVGGIPEYLTDGVNALLVPPEDPTALAGALERVVRNREEAAKLGANARTLFEMRHTIGELGRDFADLLEPLVSARKQDNDALIAPGTPITA
jgi:glycosyltransferase involved in cell wall biosynthesis